MESQLHTPLPGTPVLLLGLVLAIILVACGTTPAAPPQAEAPTEVTTATLAEVTATAADAAAVAVTATTTEDVAATDDITATDAVTETQPDGDATATPVDETQAVINEITAQVRHWQGEPDAPVTIIDFSDFL